MVKNLKKLRLERGISQQTLAAAVGTSQQSINKYENHKVEPDIAMLIKLADYFDTTTDYLISRTDENGNNIKPSDSDLLIRNYRHLDKKQKLCVEMLIDTFVSSKTK